MRAALIQLLCQPVHVPPEVAEVRLHDVTVVDDYRGVCVAGRLDVQYGGCDGGLRRVEYHVQPAVGLEYAVFDLADVENALIAQLLHQLVEREAVLVQLALYHLAAQDEHARPAEKQAAQAYTFQRRACDQHLAAEERQYRHEAVYQRYADILKRMRGEISDKRRQHEFRQLHFAELPFPKQTHSYEKSKIYNQRAD